MESKPLTGYPSIDKPWLKYYSEEAVCAEIPRLSIYEWIREHNKDNQRDIAISYLGCKISYGDFFRQIEEAAFAFTQLGVRKGDIVTLALPNIPENIISIYALNYIGAISNLIDLRYKGDDLIRYYNEVNSSIAIVSDIFLSNTLAIVGRTSLKKLIIASPYDHLPLPARLIMKRKYHIPKTENIRMITWKSFVGTGEGKTADSVKVNAKDTACIMHTSGTTGASKGVMLSNHCFNAMAFQCEWDGFEYHRGDRCLNQVPPFLAYNILLSTHLPLSLQMNIVLLPDYNPEKFAANVMKYKPNHVMAGPADWSNFLNNNISDLSFLRALLSGSDTIRSEDKQKINTILETHGCRTHVMEGYGMTEVGSAACTNLPQCEVDKSVGIPLPKMTFCIWNNDSQEELPYYTKGEICITGPTLMNGYYNMPDETAAVLKEHSDGTLWMHSGDLGYMDENGCVFLEGRIKRIIIQYNGMKVNPYEIENVLLKDEDVIECCVVGVPDIAHGSGTCPVAFVVVAKNDQFSNERIKSRLLALCNMELVERYRPYKIYFLGSLPLTPNGKVDYRSLEKMAKTIKIDKDII